MEQNTRPDSLASIVEEFESGRMSLGASNDELVRKLQISDFALEKDLGEGAYAFVKQGRYRWEEEAKPVVIKMMIKSKLQTESILHDFDTGLSLPIELYALRHLREHPHPNIVSMIDAFEDPQYYYILMPMHGRGEDLFEYIEKHGDFISPEKVARIFSQVVMAIAHLHRTLGLVHRDIKDENIIIDENDRILLIDFGSCAYYRGGMPLTEADVRRGKRLPYFDVFHGSIDYASPEVLRNEPYDGPQQDVWALGVLLYTLTFKEVPFRSTSDVLEGRLRLPFESDLEISAMIKAILSPDPTSRPTAEVLAEHPWIVKNYEAAMN
ncbi:putative serine threonine protein kinase [Paramicrosporidium saccamoebae]|uniref:Putative serine threonine protein kinase n=1 Tax=Paramicrosporidium saccamoebae TaxID=1246581 RepID=A0A2H9TMI5_9FUNG|nr:putative serine threonine protein kinase [Paramicrosporidium saccamoebae]